MGINCPTVP
jgi:hypothetical protein